MSRNLRISLMIVLGAALLVAPQAFSQRPAPDPLKALQGTWIMDAIERNGVLEDQSFKGERLSFRGNQVIGDSQSEGVTHRSEARVIGVQGKVTELDIMANEGPARGKFYRAICSVEGDILHYCYNQNSGGPRPTRFTTREDLGWYYSVWKLERR